MLAHLAVQNLSPFLELLLSISPRAKRSAKLKTTAEGVASSGIAASTKRAFLLGISGEQH
jgi:hypothetical protein